MYCPYTKCPDYVNGRHPEYQEGIELCPKCSTQLVEIAPTPDSEGPGCARADLGSTGRPVTGTPCRDRTGVSIPATRSSKAVPGTYSDWVGIV
jgi:hypothetical protein